MPYALVALLLLIQPLPPPFPRDGANKVFENEQVIIWDVSWAKGEPTPLHEHRFASLAVTVQPGRVKSYLADGTTRVGASEELGSVQFSERGLVHREEGVSDAPRRAFVLELKETTAPVDAIPDGAVPAWPREGAKNILENELVVVWDYAFAADHAVPLHYHDKDQIIVSLGVGKIRMIPLDGDPIVSESKGFRAVFIPRGALHREEYLEGAPHAIVVQLKR